jgi:RimJ/RimL family protein N-acetyltransferase
MIPTLETVRLRIRPLVAEDLEDCHSLHVEIDWIDHELDLAANRAKRASWLAWTIDSYRELAGLHQPPYGERAVERRSDGVFLGLVGLVPSLAAFGQLPGFGARRDARVRPEVGLFWALRPSAQGSGFATEAAAALMAYARDELLDQVGLFPGEAAFVVGLAAEVAVGRGAGVDRAVEAEVFADGARRGAADHLRQGQFQLGRIDFAGAVQVDVEAQRIGHADGVG